MEHTIQAPINRIKDSKEPTQYLDITGQLYRIKIQGQPFKFLVHPLPTDNKLYVSHYESGMKLGCVTKVRLANIDRHISRRQGAVMILDQLIKKHGVEEVLHRLNNSPVVNHYQINRQKAWERNHEA